MINQARNKQRQTFVLSLGLKYAFGEVDHRLILKVLGYHHLLARIKALITDYYAISVGTDDYSTEPIIADNMIVNTLIKSNDHEKFRCMGYSSPKTLLHVTSFNLLMIRLRNIN